MEEYYIFKDKIISDIAIKGYVEAIINPCSKDGDKSKTLLVAFIDADKNRVKREWRSIQDVDLVKVPCNEYVSIRSQHDKIEIK